MYHHVLLDHKRRRIGKHLPTAILCTPIKTTPLSTGQRQTLRCIRALYTYISVGSSISERKENTYKPYSTLIPPSPILVYRYSDVHVRSGVFNAAIQLATRPSQAACCFLCTIAYHRLQVATVFVILLWEMSLVNERAYRVQLIGISSLFFPLSLSLRSSRIVPGRAADPPFDALVVNERISAHRALSP